MNTVSRPASDPAAREMADLIEQLSARLQTGDEIDWVAVERDHPAHAAELRRLLPTLAVLADLSRSADMAGPPGGGPGHRELGDFRIVREVGRGGMGVVYEAEQLSLGRRVALKVLPLAGAMDPRHLQRFQIEARAAAGLHHPHIVPVYAVGTDRGVHFYAMQFVDGQTVAEVIGRLREPAADPAASTVARVGAKTLGPGLTDPRAVAQLIADAADALDYAHSLGIVHRDVKPGNLLVDAAGRVWVTDFGLAKLGADVGLTITGDVLGTLRYMSPEQALARHGLVDHRADVYALGATLYEVLTGTPAVPGDERAEVLRRLSEADPVPPRKLVPAVPRDLETVALKCLEKDPARRYQSARELAEDLRRFLGQKPVRAKRPGAIELVRKWAGRHRAMVRSAAAVFVLGVLGLAVGTWLIWREKEATDRARARAEDKTRWARRAVNDMYVQVAERWLARQPHLTDVQREFLRNAVEFYEELAREEAIGPDERLERAAAYRRLGDVADLLWRDSERGEDAYRRAIALLVPLLDESPNDARYRRELAGAERQLGAYLRKRDRTAEAESLLVRALDRSTRLATEAPDDPRATRDRAACEREVGELLLVTGRFAAAEGAYRRAVAEYRRLADLDPGELDDWESLAQATGDVGGVLLLAGRFPEAGSWYQDAAALWEKVMAGPGRMSPGRNPLGACYNGLGFVRTETGDLAGAETALDQSLAVRRRVYLEYPSPENRHGVANTQINRARLLARTGRPLAADAAWRGAGEYLHALVERFPDHPSRRQELAYAYACRAWLRALGPLVAWDAEEAHEFIRLARELEPARGRWLSLVEGAVQYRRRAWAEAAATLRPFAAIGDPPAAVPGWTTDQVAVRHDAEARERLAPALGAFLLAMSEWQLGERDGARAHFQRANQLADGAGVISPLLRGEFDIVRAEAVRVLEIGR